MEAERYLLLQKIFSEESGTDIEIDEVCELGDALVAFYEALAFDEDDYGG